MLPAIGKGRLLRGHLDDPAELRLPVDTETAWRDFHSRLRGFVARRVRQRADAEDIVQKVFLQMHRSRGSLRSADKVGAWLYQAARNAITDHYRSAAGRHEVTSGDTRDLDSAATRPGQDDGQLSRDTLASCLRPMIDQLPAHYGRALELVELRGVSQVAAATAEGLSVSGMKTRVQRARLRLKAALLDCCRISLDRRGGVAECAARINRGPCGPSECQS